MKKIIEVQGGTLKGVLYLAKYGYTFKITGKICGKTYTLGRNCTYIMNKDFALKELKLQMEVLEHQTALFNLKDYERTN